MTRKAFAFIVLMLALSACSQPATPTTQPQPTVAPTTASATATQPVPTPVPPTATTEPAATPTVPGVTPSPDPTPLAGGCSTAYSSGNTLYCLGEGGTPVEIAQGEGTIGNVKISPDGLLVAYTDTLSDGTNPLWVVNADGSDAHPLVAREQLPPPDPNRIDTVFMFEWQPGTHTIFFNTRYIQLPEPVGLGERVNADLWKVSADTGDVQNVLGRESAGRFHISPDGETIALVLPQAIEMMDAAATEKRTVLEFEMILTFSEYIYYPDVTWSPDSSFFSVAIPSRDAFAEDASVTLYRVNVSGETEELATYAGNYVTGGALHFAPDGDHLMAIRVKPGGEGGQQLVLLQPDGSGEEVLDAKPVLTGLGWATDSQHYAYTANVEEGGAFVTDPEGNIQTFAPGLQVVRLQWLDEAVVAFQGVAGGEWGLYFQRIGDEQSLQQVADVLSLESAFDVRR